MHGNQEGVLSGNWGGIKMKQNRRRSPAQMVTTKPSARISSERFLIHDYMRCINE